MTRNIPTGYIPHTVNDLLAVYTKPLQNGVAAIAYIGKRRKAAWHYSFKSMENMEGKISSTLAHLTNWEEVKMARRNERKNGLTQTKIIKQALSTFPYKMSVTKGKGTAAAWIHVNVYGVEADKQGRQILHDEIYKIIKLALAKAGEETGKDYSLSTYCSDDGYNTDSECLIIQLHTS